MKPPPEPGEAVPVWDIGIRLFHWLLVLAVTVAALTGFFALPDLLDIHLIAGGTIAALLLCRVVWGVLGGRFARFSGFAYRPRAVLAHARGMRAGRRPAGEARYLGHNPLGGLMVFALLAVLAASVATGVVTLGGFDKQGPLAAFTRFATGAAVKQLHQLLALLLVAMVAAHLGGVWFESWRERDNLAVAMLTGRKHAPPPPPSTVRARIWPALALCLGGLVLGAGGVFGLAALPALGVPSGALDPAYLRECGACHVAYPPSLLPAAAWGTLLLHTGQHFGSDARVAPAVAAQLRTWLMAQSAEHWDTQAAVGIRTSMNPAEPERITASGFWRRKHRGIPAATFENPLVDGRGNCERCHADAASGRFSPQGIGIPGGLPGR